jgi:putative transposase
MMTYNPHRHRRRSIRLKGYDYAQAGLYFITICCQHRASRFGHIQNDDMILNDAGKMVAHWYDAWEHKFPDMKCHTMVIMPNHFHCIIENTGDMVNPVGADPCVCPIEMNEPIGNDHGIVENDNVIGHIGGDNGIVGNENVVGRIGGDHGTIGGDHGIVGGNNGTIGGDHMGSPLRGTSLGNAVAWFKTMTTNHYIRGVKQFGWERFDGKLWQRNYWEHIIRNENDYERITQYILNNPKNWNDDALHHSIT